MEAVGERLAEVRDRIARAGGGCRSITVVAVTKGFGLDAVRAAHEAGLRDVGENYAQELVAKWDRSGETSMRSTLRWHFLGAVQRNKARRLAPVVHTWQGVDRVQAGTEIGRHAPGARVLVQVNATAAPHRNGCSWEEAPALVDALRGEDLDVRGLMCVGPHDDPRPPFRRLAHLAAQLELPEVSMGMSEDLEVAVQEGATMLRVGAALFGPRPRRADLRR